MRKREFDVLYLLDELNQYDKEYYAKALFVPEEEIADIMNTLRELKYVSGDTISKEGKLELEKYRIHNAVILAAGTSSRFVPLNFEKPKGLLKVKGETLIERQICQLREKGISEIIVVVGYMKERFAFLKDKYGVILVKAMDYESKNNHASVYAAKKYLNRTIVTSSDLYFSENVFQKYAYDAYYCTIYVAGTTAERGIVTDEDDKIIETMYGGG